MEDLIIDVAVLDMLWIVFSAILVFFMQAGFAMLEAGLTRAKNTANILMKNISDMCIGAISYFLLGWGLMYGSSYLGLIGTDQFALVGVDNIVYRDWFFQVVFAATAATIISGAMSERAKFVGYLIVSLFITGVVYPISGNWVWNSGWLASLGFYDFAGSTVVHLLGGMCALWAAFFLGPRNGKFIKRNNGTIHIRSFPGHSIPLAGLGIFILWFGWYGFNGGSVLSGTDPYIALVLVNTTLGAASGTLGAMFIIVLLYKKVDVPFTLNGALGGLVSITAGAYVFSPIVSIITGFIGGIIVIFAALVVERIIHIDDPVGAFSVHGVCGIWGTLAVALFGDFSIIGTTLNRIQMLGVQLLGVLAFVGWSSISCILLFSILKATNLLRVSKREEIEGLDIMEHGNESYSGFQIIDN